MSAQDASQTFPIRKVWGWPDAIGADAPEVGAGDAGRGAGVVSRGWANARLQRGRGQRLALDGGLASAACEARCFFFFSFHSSHQGCEERPIGPGHIPKALGVGQRRGEGVRARGRTDARRHDAARRTDHGGRATWNRCWSCPSANATTAIQTGCAQPQPGQNPPLREEKKKKKKKKKKRGKQEKKLVFWTWILFLSFALFSFFCFVLL